MAKRVDVAGNLPLQEVGILISEHWHLALGYIAGTHRIAKLAIYYEYYGGRGEPWEYYGGRGDPCEYYGERGEPWESYGGRGEPSGNIHFY